MDQSINPRAVVGDNQAPDYAKMVTDQMERDYAALTESVLGLLEKARAAPHEVGSDEEAIALGVIVKDLRDAYNRADAYRTAEKEPYLRREQAVDAFFFQWMEKCRRRNPRDRSQRAGAADILQARIDDFVADKLARAEAEREREAAEALRIAKEAKDKAGREAREAEERRAEAERARKPEIVKAKSEVAAEAEQKAAVSAADAAVAVGRAQDAHIATLAAPAEMARTRGEGVLLTVAKENYAYVLERAKLDMAKLAPFFTDAEVEKALRAWAKNTGYNQPMDGAEIGKKNKGITR